MDKTIYKAFEGINRSYFARLLDIRAPKVNRMANGMKLDMADGITAEQGEQLAMLIEENASKLAGYLREEAQEAYERRNTKQQG